MMSMQKNPTILDVARTAGVSKSTVSRVLQGTDTSVSERTRQQVMAAIASLGYAQNAVARGLRTNRTHMVMLLLPNIDNPFWPGVARGLQDGMARAGYGVVFANSDWNYEQERNLMEMVRRNRFDAIALNPARISPEELKSLGIPTVILGLRQKYAAFDMAGSDSYQGTLQALNYLYDLGHRRIGLIWGHRGTSQSRRRAYGDFHAAKGLVEDQELIVGAPYSVEGGREATRQLLNLHPRPSAIFASNDVLALAAIQAASEQNLNIPGDLSIVGMDDIESAAMSTPRLTTIAKDKYAIGQQAARLLLNRLQGAAPAEPERAIVPCTLIERQSAAPFLG